MSFSRLFLVAAAGLSSLPCNGGSLEDEQIRAAWQAGREATYTGRDLDAEEIAATGQALRSVISRESETPSRQIAGELIGFTTAVAWAKQGDYEKAGDAFAQEITAQESALNPFLQNTRNPYYFAQDVFVLHSEIAAHTEQEIANTGYLAFPVGGASDKAFVFIYTATDAEEKGVVILGVDPSVQRRMIYITAPGPQGRYHISDRAQVLADRTLFSAALKFDGSQPYLALDGVKRVVKYNSGSLPAVFDCPVTRLNLNIEGGKVEQPCAALVRQGYKPTPFADDFGASLSIMASSSNEIEPPPEPVSDKGSSAPAHVGDAAAILKRGLRVNRQERSAPPVSPR